LVAYCSICFKFCTCR